MIKTVVENDQNLIIEGCYIPFDWHKDFSEEYLEHIKYYCLILSENYISKHFDDIKKYADIIEKRLDDSYCTLESVLTDNAYYLKKARKYNLNYLLIDDEYKF